MKGIFLPLLAACMACAPARAAQLVVSPADPKFERAVNCMAMVAYAEQGRNEFALKLAGFTIEFRAMHLAAKGETDPVCVAAWSRHRGGFADYSATQSQRALREIYERTEAYRKNLEWAKSIARKILLHQDDVQLSWMRRTLDDTCQYFENVDLRKETATIPRVVRWVRANRLTDTPHFQLTPTNLIIVGCRRAPQSADPRSSPAAPVPAPQAPVTTVPIPIS